MRKGSKPGSLFKTDWMAPPAGDEETLHQHNNYDPYFFMRNYQTQRNDCTTSHHYCVFFLIGMFYLHHVIKFQNSANAVPTDFPVISSNHQAMVTGTGVSQKLLLLKQLFFHFRNQILELQCLCDNQTPSDLSDICP